MTRYQMTVLFLCLFMAAAGAPFARAQGAPAPMLASIDPNSAPAGGSGFVLTAFGSNFLSNSVIQWNRKDKRTTFVPGEPYPRLTTDVYAEEIASPGTAYVRVCTGQMCSQELPFEIVAARPTITALGPPGAAAGGAAFTLAVTGTGFGPGAVVRWNGSDRTTRYVGATRLSADITAADIAQPGTASVTVVNPPPTGGESNAVPFVITMACGYAIDPAGRRHGPGTGAGSVAVTAASGCQWSAFSNADWLRVTSGASGSGNGTVTYALDGNQNAAARTGTLTIAGKTFSVMQDGTVTPVITGLQPSRVIAGGQAFDLLVLGSDFLPGASVLWNGLPRPTAFIGSTQLRARIQAADIAQPGSASVTVENPLGRTSAAKTITIMSATNPVPEVKRLSPRFMLQGSAGFTLTVIGGNFVPGSAVLWNGSPRGTTFESPTILTAAIAAADVAGTGSALVSVRNPAPGGGDSNSLEFVIRSGTVITDLSPVSVSTPWKGFKLNVFGKNFTPGSSGGSAGAGRSEAQTGPTVLWNGQPVPTVTVSSTELQADVPGNQVGSGGGTVEVSGGGGGASNSIPVPVTVTTPTPTLEGLNPKSTAPGSGQLTLTLEGRNFTEGSKVLWDGAERTTSFVDSTKLQAVIPAGDIATAGMSRVTVANPLPGGESNAQTFVYVPSLLYPRLASSARTSGGGPDDSEYTGIAFTNLGSQAGTVSFAAFDKTGSPIAGSGITNPAALAIEPGRQLAVVDYQVFGASLPAQKPLGWFRMESSAGGLVGFFLMFNETLSILDGTDVSSRTHTSFVLPEIEADGFTQVHAVNPDVQPAEVLFELVSANGAVRANATRNVAANAAAVEKLTELFPGVTAASGDYVRVVSNRGVVLFEYLGKSGQYVEGLNGQDAEGGATVLYSPQYAVGGGDWWTALSVVNLEDRPGVVTLRLIGDNGVQLGNTVVRTLAARGKLRIEDQNIFVTAGSALTQGYVKVESDGIRLAGSVVFGDPARSRFASALPLVGQMKTDMVFSQLVSNETYFTGLAILNPGASEVTCHIEAFDQWGNLIASKDQTIQPGRRISKLMIEHFEQMKNQNYGMGYIRVQSTGGVASFALFGTNSLTALSAVPAQDAP
jgi:hypothetical protein